MIERNPCGGRKGIRRKGPPVKWSKDPAKRKRQAEHVAAFYEGETMAEQLAHYRNQQENEGWNVAAVYEGPIDYDGLAQEVSDNRGATEIAFDEVPF